MTDSILQYLLGSITTLLGGFFSYWLSNKEKNKETKKISLAVKALFLVSIHSYRKYFLSNDPLPWQDDFWDNHQFEIAKYFPEEAHTFATLLLEQKKYRAVAEDSLKTLKIDVLVTRLKSKDI